MKTITTIIFAIIFVTLITVSCQKHDCQKPNTPTLTDAIITGNDIRDCACCGGLMITFSSDTKTYSAPFFDIGQMPANTGIDEKSTFPIYVKVKYATSKANCGNSIDISILERK